jgi:hypothetical protein
MTRNEAIKIWDDANQMSMMPHPVDNLAALGLLSFDSPVSEVERAIEVFREDGINPNPVFNALARAGLKVVEA